MASEAVLPGQASSLIGGSHDKSFLRHLPPTSLLLFVVCLTIAGEMV